MRCNLECPHVIRTHGVEIRSYMSCYSLWATLHQSDPFQRMDYVRLAAAGIHIRNRTTGV